MEKMHTEPGSAADLEVREAPRKAWHPPSVRWLDVRETQHGVSGLTDGGGLGDSIS